MLVYIFYSGGCLGNRSSNSYVPPRGVVLHNGVGLVTLHIGIMLLHKHVYCLVILTVSFLIIHRKLRAVQIDINYNILHKKNKKKTKQQQQQQQNGVQIGRDLHKVIRRNGVQAGSLKETDGHLGIHTCLPSDSCHSLQH